MRINHLFIGLVIAMLGVAASANAQSVKHIQTSTPGGIAMAGSIGFSGLDYSYINYAFLLTEPDGSIKSFNVVGDSTYNTFPKAVSSYPGGFFAVSSTMSGWTTNDGSFVNYYGSTSIVGTMRIDRFNSEGQFTGSRALTGYPGYGIIKTIRQTSDGGYVLCGTVGNNGSSVSVSIWAWS